MIIFDDFDGYHPKAGPHCMACEAMLADAVDGTLGEVDRTWFEQHIQSCVVCSERFANAQRGSAWLELLKTTRPEPGADLMARILAETSEKAPSVEDLLAQVPVPVAVPAVNPFLSGNLIPFPRMVQPKAPWKMLLEPRLAMTAAMAFFSIALSLNLSGVRLGELHASDLKPANLERSYDAAHNRAVQYYDSLRVVHVMESRLEDIKEANADRVQRNMAPGTQDAPGTQPQSGQPKAEPKDDKKNGGGSSRRESLGRPSSVVVAEENRGDSLWSKNSLLAAVWNLNFAGGRG